MIKRKNKHGQDKKQAFSLCSKRAQEEMVGFALIMIIVAVILLIFIGFTITRPAEQVESYEVESFLQSAMSYTTDCRDNTQRLPINDLILRCESNSRCIDDRNTCDVLKETLEGIMSESWKVENSPVLGYNLSITSDNDVVMIINAGNKTNNYKTAFQILPRDTKAVLNVYY